MKQLLRAPHHAIRQFASRTLRSVWGHITGAPDFSIIVFQMGKVGSRTVYESLVRTYRKLRQPVDIYHSHILCNFENAEAIIRKERINPGPTLAVINAGRELRREIDSSPTRQWRIITLVRDPIARNVGTFFQVLDEHIPNWQEKYSNGMLHVEEVQQAFLNARSIHSEPVRWFDEQLLPVFGVDVFSEPFPRETGYKIYNANSRMPVLLIRLEDLNRVGALALQEFLGLKDIELVSTNIGEEKEYAELYRLFKQNPLPKDYINEMYSSRCAQTFYTPADIAGFTLKWSGPKGGHAASDTEHPPVIVYQMGKVGSKTIEHSLRYYYQSRGMDVEVYHAHFLNYLDEMEQNGRKNKISRQGLQHIHEMMALKKKIDSDPNRKWRLISLVRDPVARNIASFFQALSVNQFIPDWKERYQKGDLKVEELLEKFLSLGDDYHNYPATWFDSQLKPVFGIDVFETPFPHQTGYKIYPATGNSRLLVMRAEDLSRCASQAMFEYLGLENFTLLNSNTSDEKDYVDVYNEFKKLPLPLEYVNKIYGTKYAQHFYSAAELDAFRRKWAKEDLQIETP
ncbi:MAG: putative capsular polysaccharide synthesis family protein [Chloroflexota bacterium]|nr:sulfotransferase family 2 domain-containing protein [Chloroflexota bacterium]MBI5702102.1 sulfotransferase family 2 domain-containing protein [Chloroflexota bacterium]